ncbi:uncharacterized protein PTP-ER [Eurosta solidaginis]|uniref:uncharacterized protein PTP-ER n=1 Tax=Eurosta solidaginis TaxID=178769 RepID=UPI003530C3AF
MEHCKNNNEQITSSQQYSHHTGSNSNCATPSTPSEQPSRNQFFEYTPPTHDLTPITGTMDNDDMSSSNKSTPYYTPMEFLQGTFDFPSPTKLVEHMDDIVEVHCIPNMSSQMHEHKFEGRGNQRKTPTPTQTPTTTTTPMPTSRSLASARQQLSVSSTSPVVSRKLRRFSLYERRSCSPKQLLLKNAVSASMDSSSGSTECVADKENAKPYCRTSGGGIADRRDTLIRSSSGNSSPPTTLIDAAADSISSPKIHDINMMAGGSNGGSCARLPCSPKLLTSLNNLNITGSPLGVISSAGYKNGNYFKFPEIDQMVQQEQSNTEQQADDINASFCDNQNQQTRNSRQRSNIGVGCKERQRSGFKNANSSSQDKSSYECASITLPTTKSSAIPTTTTLTSLGNKKNRKNKNNLTIKITDLPCNIASGNATISTTSSPSTPKPKTPTIKSTKEKALSLDSAARDNELTIIVSPTGRNNSHASCDEIEAQPLHRSCLPIQQQQQHVMLPRSVSGARFERYASSERSLRIPSAKSNRSTSLSQLALLGEGMQATHAHLQTQSLCGSSIASSLKTPLSGSSFPRTPRRRLAGGINNTSAEWLVAYHRNLSSADACGSSVGGTGDLEYTTEIDIDTVDILQEKAENSNDGVKGENNNAPLGAPYGDGGAITSTLTLTPHRGVHKHNTLLHASSTNLKTLPEFLTLVEFSTTTAAAAHQPYKQKSMELPNVATRPKPTGSVSTNLLQRRGSNHSLTLNLHGSCGNLLGNCRSGLSVSNYSLGPTSGAQSTTNLNSKSNCNLDKSSGGRVSGAPIIQQPQPQASTTQGAKQSLFHRRGSNQSLTLTNLTAASCGNLNTFASQHSPNKVTRTTSFVTPTQNTTSNVAPTKRGLLERRGSNQSLTLNMGGSFGGIGTERHMHASSGFYLGDACTDTADLSVKATTLSCAPPTPHRRFFSSESLNRGSTPFADLNQAHRRNAKQVCFGSVSDLKPSASMSIDCGNTGGNVNDTGVCRTSTTVNHGNQSTQMSELRRDSFNFQDSTICSCTGVRNIITRPLSPQSTSEEFKIYLANIQMLQNASNVLNQFDLIKLNYILDNSYAPSNKGLAEKVVPMLSVRSNKEAETHPGMFASTSEDCEVATRYLDAVETVLETIKPNEDEQKRIFCDLHKEFWDLPLNHQEKPMVFGSQAKNRYKTILPNENSRVLLEKEGKQLIELIEDIQEDHMNLAKQITRLLNFCEEVPYINANYIKGPDYTSKCYVATQGPLPNTIYEFWLMVYQNTRRYFQTSDENKAGQMQFYQKIIMLTSFAENNRQKCAVYFPVELNEVIITTNWHEVITPTAEALEFFNSYLHPNETKLTPLNLNDGGGTESAEVRFGIDCYRVKMDEDLQQFLPPSRGNYFVIKNIGIVRKNGFSIRKLVLLYCINLGTEATADMSAHLLINRLFCYHYWYPDWPDHRSPRDINTLLDICLHILNLGKCESEFDAFDLEDDENGDDDVIPVLKPTPQKHTAAHMSAQTVDLYQQDIFNAMQPLPIIHCSAGIGRTGCLTAILNAVRQLRQSFAYSLTTMAAEACAVEVGERGEENSAGAGGEIAAQKTFLSPVDFELPLRFVSEAQYAVLTSDGVSDTDSSFTRNTLYYINYILQRQRQQNRASVETNVKDTKTLTEEFSKSAYLEHMSVESEESNKIVTWTLPSIKELPKLPDIFVDVLGIVCNLRLQRGGMVQNSEQYELIHRAICLYMKRTFALKRF